MGSACRRVCWTSIVGLGLAGCLEHPLKPVGVKQQQETQGTFPLEINRDVDVLFVIDDSLSMSEEQALLARNFERFISKLEDPQVQANYRVAITTTDAGGPACDNFGFSPPEQGAFVASSCRQRLDDFRTATDDVAQEACTDICPHAQITIAPTRTSKDGVSKPRPWIERTNGVSNLPPEVTTAEAFQCFGPQGIKGCGYEQQLQSMFLGLSRTRASSEPEYGFLRNRALLSIVHVTDEADCSIRPEFSEVFTPNNKVFWDPTATYATSAICWNAGVVCEGDQGGVYASCEPADLGIDGLPTANDDASVMFPVQHYIDALRRIETDKQPYNPGARVLVSVIGGVPEGYDGAAVDVVYREPTDASTRERYGIDYGCVHGDNGGAVPPVRLRAFAEAFAAHDETNLFSICADDYSAALSAMAEEIKQELKPACMPACVADLDTVLPGLQPSCTVTERFLDDQGQGQSRDLPRCTGTAETWDFPSGSDACWLPKTDDQGLTATTADDLDPRCIDAGFNLEFEVKRIAGTEPNEAAATATCELSQLADLDCPGLTM